MEIYFSVSKIIYQIYHTDNYNYTVINLCSYISFPLKLFIRKILIYRESFFCLLYHPLGLHWCFKNPKSHHSCHGSRSNVQEIQHDHQIQFSRETVLNDNLSCLGNNQKHFLVPSKVLLNILSMSIVYVYSRNFEITGVHSSHYVSFRNLISFFAIHMSSYLTETRHNVGHIGKVVELNLQGKTTLWNFSSSFGNSASWFGLTTLSWASHWNIESIKNIAYHIVCCWLVFILNEVLCFRVVFSVVRWPLISFSNVSFSDCVKSDSDENILRHFRSNMTSTSNPCFWYHSYQVTAVSAITDQQGWYVQSY